MVLWAIIIAIYGTRPIEKPSIGAIIKRLSDEYRVNKKTRDEKKPATKKKAVLPFVSLYFPYEPEKHFSAPPFEFI